MRTLLAIPLALTLVSTAARAHDHEKAQKQAVAEHLAQAIHEHETALGEGAHGEATGDEHGHGGHDISQINWVRWYWSEGYTKKEGAPFVAMVFNFLVLVLLLYFAARKSVARFLKDRRDRLMENIDEASRVKKEAEESHKHYAERLSMMKQEEQQIRDELLKAAVRDKDRVLADAGSRAEKMRAEARRLVDQEQAEASSRLRREAAIAAVDVAREVLTKKIGPGEQRKLVDHYLGQLGGQVKA